MVAIRLICPSCGKEDLEIEEYIMEGYTLKVRPHLCNSCRSIPENRLLFAIFYGENWDW